MKTNEAEKIIDSVVESKIKDKLEQIESEYQVKVLFACESGSRAWDFASPDSDYDVRFIYLHRRDWYLMVDKDYQRDVIELPIVDDLDINGWDLQKALKLMRKSNPALLEWIASPIVYKDENGFQQQISKLAEQYICPRRCFYHYQHMAERNYREHLTKGMVKTKKYFYVLRPLLAMRWLEQRKTQVPMQFRTLLDAMCTNLPVKRTIEGLLAQKAKSKECQFQPAISMLNSYIEQELADAGCRAKMLDKTTTNYQAINNYFLQLLDRIKD